MKYIGYLILILGIVAGYIGIRVWFVFGLALLSTFVFASERRRNVKDTPGALPPNMLLDGAFLFASQILILFAAYLLGAFIASPGGELFADFLTGQRAGPSSAE